MESIAGFVYNGYFLRNAFRSPERVVKEVVIIHNLTSLETLSGVLKALSRK